MYKLHKIWLGTISALLLPTIVSAGSITQVEFLDRLKATHPLFEKESLTAEIEHKKSESYLADQDWNVRSSFFYSHDEPSIAFPGQLKRTDAVSFSGGVERAVWSTGGRFSATYSSNYTSIELDPSTGASSFPDSYFENRLAVTYSHPLLRNKSGRLDRLQYDLSKFDIDISEEISLENEERFLAESAAMFLDWVFLTEQKRIFIERLKLSNEELARTRDKRALNLIDEVDVIRAEDASRLAKQNLLLIESQVKALRSELAVLTQDNDLREMSPLFDMYKMTTVPTLSEVRTFLQNDSRLLNAIAIRIDQQNLLKLGFADQTKADLSLIAQVGLKNAEPSYGRSLAMDIPEARVGLQLGFPVRARRAKTQLAQTDLVTQQLEIDRQRLNIELTSKAANLLTQATELEAVLILNAEQIDSAKRKTEEELKLYNQGRGELTFVIQSRDSEQAAQLTYALNSLNYQKLVLALSELTDQFHK